MSRETRERAHAEPTGPDQRTDLHPGRRPPDGRGACQHRQPDRGRRHGRRGHRGGRPRRRADRPRRPGRRARLHRLPLPFPGVQLRSAARPAGPCDVGRRGPAAGRRGRREGRAGRLGARSRLGPEPLARGRLPEPPRPRRRGRRPAGLPAQPRRPRRLGQQPGAGAGRHHGRDPGPARRQDPARAGRHPERRPAGVGRRAGARPLRSAVAGGCRRGGSGGPGDPGPRRRDGALQLRGRRGGARAPDAWRPPASFGCASRRASPEAGWSGLPRRASRPASAATDSRSAC